MVAARKDSHRRLYKRVKSKMKTSVYVIAEIGINHEGRITDCLEMISAAKESGADAVKLQIIDPEKCYAKKSESFRLFKSASLARAEISEVFDFAKHCDVDIFATAGDSETILWVDSLDPCGWKISSGLLTHHEIIKCVVRLNRHVYVSTGMADTNDIDDAVHLLSELPKKQCSLLHCRSIYPTPAQDINLSRLAWLKARYGMQVGYSDHSIESLTVPAAVALGAEVIEKHFTLDETRPGFDHHISFEPRKFRQMVDQIREVECMLGVAELTQDPEIEEVKRRMSRWVVAARPLKIGHVVTEKDLEVKRPSKCNLNPIPPSNLESIVGRELKNSYCQGEALRSTEVTG